MSVAVSLGAKPAQTEESVELHTDLTPLHSCTFASLVSRLVCALDHPPNAFALAEVVPQNRVAFDNLTFMFACHLWVARQAGLVVVSLVHLPCLSCVSLLCLPQVVVSLVSFCISPLCFSYSIPCALSGAVLLSCFDSCVL